MEMPASRFNSLAVGVRPSLRAAALRAATICFLLRALVLGIREPRGKETHLSLGLKCMFRETGVTGKPGTARQRRRTEHFIVRRKCECKRYLGGRVDWEYFLSGG